MPRTEATRNNLSCTHDQRRHGHRQNPCHQSSTLPIYYAAPKGPRQGTVTSFTALPVGGEFAHRAHRTLLRSSTPPCSTSSALKKATSSTSKSPAASNTKSTTSAVLPNETDYRRASATWPPHHLHASTAQHRHRRARPHGRRNCRRRSAQPREPSCARGSPSHRRRHHPSWISATEAAHGNEPRLAVL